MATMIETVDDRKHHTSLFNEATDAHRVVPEKKLPHTADRTTRLTGSACMLLQHQINRLVRVGSES